MTENNRTVVDYGWDNGEPRQTQTYLSKPIIETLKNLKASKILDLGCGNGAFSHCLQTHGFSVIGCDTDQTGIDIAQKNNSGAKFKLISIYDSPPSLAGESFDAVVSTEVIEHLFLPAALPLFAAAALKPHGYLIITTPYHGYFKNLLICLTGKWDTHHTALWDGGHIKFWSYRTLSKLLEANGFEVIGFRGAGRVYGLWKSMIIIAKLRR